MSRDEAPREGDAPQDEVELELLVERLREREERLAEAQAIAHVGSWDWDIERDVITWSDELFRIYGLEKDSFSLQYHAYLERVHPNDRELVQTTVRRALQSGGSFHYDHRIVRPDGVVRIVHARGRVELGESGAPRRMSGTTQDVTEEREAERRLAQAEAERAVTERLSKLLTIAEAGLMHLTLDELLPELLERISAALELEHAAVLLIEEGGEMLELRAAHGPEAQLDSFRLAVGEGFAGRIAAQRRLTVLERGAYERLANPLLRRERIESIAGLPLLIEDEVAGVLHVGSRTPRRFSEDELAMLQLAAERAALAIRHSRLFEREQRIAETLQRSLLPREDNLPQTEWLAVSARYRPAAAGAEVGGDWFDAIPLGDEQLGLALGDVSGHGIPAAALMGELRHSLRAYALDGYGPADVAMRVHRLASMRAEDAMATLAYVAVARDGRMRCVSAGHLPPLVVGPDGRAEFLELPTGPPLGFAEGPYREVEVRLPPGATLVLYSDGLVERRGEVIDEGLERLRTAAAEPLPTAEALCAWLLDMLAEDGDPDDDVTLLVARAGARATPKRAGMPGVGFEPTRP
ncbi:MAG: SpoIIE family protein phosphatase [Nocardioidaceae bacterium]